MKNFTIALFLGSTQANELLKTLLNGPSSADNVPADQTLTTAHSWGECTSNAECTANDENELCARFNYNKLSEDDAGEVPAANSNCIHKFSCGTMGIYSVVDQDTSSHSFFASCYEDPAEGESQATPADVDVNAYLAAIKALITVTDPDAPEDDITWGDSKEFWVSPNSRYQDGWYVKAADGDNAGKYVETDKPVNNECGFNSNCLENECCVTWPDTNNKRCKAKTVDGVEQTVGPLKFTPTCAVDEDAEPDNAIEDINKNALTEAAEKLDEFFEAQLADAKTAAGYADMTADEQAAWDEKRAEITAARKEFQTKLETAMGYAGDDCDDACKAAFQADFLDWQRAKFDTCDKDAKAIECIKADDLFLQKVEARVGGDKSWYLMTKEERGAWAENFAEQAEKNASALAAAWIKENEPDAGTEGGQCNASGMKCEAGQCCGTSTPKGNADGVTDGEITNVCVVSADQKTGTYTDGLGREYTHVCFAQRLIATAAAAITAFYIM